jgi:hypothetical protein
LTIPLLWTYSSWKRPPLCNNQLIYGSTYFSVDIYAYWFSWIELRLSIMQMKLYCVSFFARWVVAGLVVVVISLLFFHRINETRTISIRFQSFSQVLNLNSIHKTWISINIDKNEQRSWKTSNMMLKGLKLVNKKKVCLR